MARFSFAVNVHAIQGNGQVSLREGSAKRLGSDANSDDVVLSINATNVKTKSNLRHVVMQLLDMACASNELTP